MPSCNNYGWSGFFAALCAGISFYLINDKTCKINLAQLFNDNLNNDHLIIFHYIAIIVGIILFVLSFLDFAGVLYEISLIFIAAVLGIFATGIMMLYATYMDFHMSCKSAFNGFLDTASLSGAKNVIEANDQVGTAIMVLDLLAALSLISAAISFYRTY